jgi:hypothetical protein
VARYVDKIAIKQLKRRMMINNKKKNTKLKGQMVILVIDKSNDSSGTPVK